MPDPPTNSHLRIPESLRLQLVDFRRRLWRMKVIEAIAAGLIGLLLSFLLVYGLDRLLPTPSWLRLFILLAGGSLCLGFAPYWLHRWIWSRRKETQIAQLIAKRYPGLGDRLLGVLELQDQQGSEETLSPRLREAAMAAVAAEAERQTLTGAMPPERHRKWAASAIGLLAVFIAILVITPQAGLNALQRWILPLSDTERYTFTKLQNPPQRIAVPFGESFDVHLTLAKNSQQKPALASGRYNHQSPLSATLDGISYRFTFPGQQDPGTVHFQIGDLHHRLKVEPMARPAVREVRAILTPPGYLQAPQRSTNLFTGSLSAVEGSVLQIEFEMTRPLAKGSRYGPLVDPASEAAAPASQDTTPLILDGVRARTREIAVTDKSFDIPFEWIDAHGLAGNPGFSIRVEAIPDAAPNSYLQGIPRQHLMLPEETIDFEVLAEDDHSVRSTGIEWQGQHTRPSDSPTASDELMLGEGKPEQRQLTAPVAFCPAAFGIEPQKITLRAWATDHLPGRERAYSEPVTIYVLTRDEHAQILKNRFDRQITELEDLARRELGLYEENQRIERLDSEQLQSEEQRQRIGKQSLEEGETQQRMDEITSEMEQLLKDAARNGDIDKETLKKMARSLQAMQELSQQDVPGVQQQLDNARDPANTPGKSKRNMNQAVENQREVLEKMNQAIAQANEANRSFEAGTFIKRLKKSAAEQRGISRSLSDAFAQLLGLEHDQVDPAELTLLNRNLRQQSDTATDIRWILEDLSHYYARTQSEEFLRILEQMRESEIVLRLQDIRSALKENHSYQAAEKALYWATLLDQWAKTLEGDPSSGGGAGAGGAGGGDSENEDFEFMLRVMKMIQQQQDLRGRTRALEQWRRDNNNTTLPES